MNYDVSLNVVNMVSAQINKMPGNEFHIEESFFAHTLRFISFHLINCNQAFI